MYLTNNIHHPPLEEKLRKAAFTNLLCSLPFLLYFLIRLVTMNGYAVDPQNGSVSLVAGKYLDNLLSMPVVLVLLLLGLVLVVAAVVITRFTEKRSGIWLGGPGTVFVGLAVFFLAGFNNTAFYPSKFDLQSSLTSYNFV